MTNVIIEKGIIIIIIHSVIMPRENLIIYVTLVPCIIIITITLHILPMLMLTHAYNTFYDFVINQ